MLYTLGLNHQTAPVAVRERLAFPGERLREALGGLRSSLNGAVRESAILSTCNRTEIYVCSEEPLVIAKHLPEWVGAQGAIKAHEITPYLYTLPQAEAVRHAFRVACGLDSMVLGEPQILGQMKEAVRVANEEGCLGTQLHALFQRTFSVAKEVRSSTEIGLHSVSMAAAAVKLSKKIFDNLSAVKVLFVGAGEMIELCAAHFAAQNPKAMAVANRSAERAHHLAERIGASTMGLNQLPEMIDQFDIVISCTASTLPIIGLGMVERAIKARKHRPIFMVDLAVPRDIEAEVARLNDVFLYTVDDLGVVVKQGQENRQVAVEQAEAIIETQVRGFLRWLDQREAVPVIRDLRARGETLRLAELDVAKRRLAKGQSPEAVLEALSQGLTQKFLHGAMTALHEAEGEDRQRLNTLLPRLFSARTHKPQQPETPEDYTQGDPT